MKILITLMGALLVVTTALAESKADVTSRPFGNTPGGTPVEIYTLKDASIEAQIMTYGGNRTNMAKKTFTHQTPKNFWRETLAAATLVTPRYLLCGAGGFAHDQFRIDHDLAHISVVVGPRNAA